MKQTDLTLIGYINKYGCFFMCIAYWLFLQVRKVEPGWKQLNTWWMFALETKDQTGRPIITGDMNGDGDMDDGNELLIGDKSALCRLIGLPLEYLGVFTPETVVKKPGQHYIGEFYREWTEGKKKHSFTHFAALDDTFAVVYDPIENSNTVKYGKLKTVRVFREV